MRVNGRCCRYVCVCTFTCVCDGDYDCRYAFLCVCDGEYDNRYAFLFIDLFLLLLFMFCSTFGDKITNL